MLSDLHCRLRDATGAAHRRLEDRLAILDRIATGAGRRELLARFWRLHAEAEAALSPWLAGVTGLDFEGRRRTEVLRRDLDALGVPLPGLGAPPSVASRSEALGRMYVLEGSTLGGRVIRRQVAEAGGDFTGLGFLDPYGATAGERWRSFLAVLKAANPDEAVAGACEGFRHAELRLCEAADA
jgi:heme oxygenase